MGAVCFQGGGRGDIFYAGCGRGMHGMVALPVDLAGGLWRVNIMVALSFFCFSTHRDRG